MKKTQKSRSPDADNGSSDDSTRIDKWLWAARFFKTRALASEAVDGGKVHLNSERVKRSKNVRIGDIISVRTGPYEHIVEVKEISDRRGPASSAALLYDETAESRATRERLAEQHRLAAAPGQHAEGRPSKRDRRQIDDWKGRGS